MALNYYTWVLFNLWFYIFDNWLVFSKEMNISMMHLNHKHQYRILVWWNIISDETIAFIEVVWNVANSRISLLINWNGLFFFPKFQTRVYRCYAIISLSNDILFYWKNSQCKYCWILILPDECLCDFGGCHVIQRICPYKELGACL